jgi:hypothetical protein
MLMLGNMHIAPVQGILGYKAKALSENLFLYLNVN